MIKNYKITVNGKSYDVTVEDGTAQPQAVPVQTIRQPESSRAVETQVSAEPQAEKISGAVEAPMPGKILKVLVAEGDTVKTGQLVVILEAMKMENEIFATADGTVQKIVCKTGASVSTGDALLVIA
ncbi:MAG: biotin/lipoyl-containing protein [Synergistaceae bacterium]|nr:biotin/lipoyl-containing protein [Synergistaceae bacterium]